MKRRWQAVLLACILILSVLTGCGGSSKAESFYSADMKTEAYFPEAPMEAPTMDMEMSTNTSAGGSTGSSAQKRTDEKLIYTAHLEMETTAFDEAIAAIEALTDSVGGYFENSSISNWRNGYRNAYYAVRVPADKYEMFLSQAGELCHVLNKEEYTENITEAYYDIEGRLTTQRTKLERLQTLLSQAETMEDIITIESAISETEQQIENLSGTLKRYDALVDYSTVNISLNEVYKLSNVEEPVTGFGSRLGSAFASGWENFVDDLEDLAVDMAYSWMQLLVLAVVIVVVVLIVRRKLKKCAAARKAKLAAKNAEKNTDDKSL